MTLERTQLPLIPCTIHKVQGLSLDGMAYRTLEGVALLGLVSEKVKASESAGQEMERLRSNVLVAAVAKCQRGMRVSKLTMNELCILCFLDHLTTYCCYMD